MFRTQTLSRLVLVCLASYVGIASAQTDSLTEPNSQFHEERPPTDQMFRVDPGMKRLEPFVRTGVLPNGPAAEPIDDTLTSHAGDPPLDLTSLLRPRVEFFAEWEPDSDGLAISSYDVSAQMPVYPFFGPPPPFINAGYSFTRIDAPGAFDLPESLHDFSLGVAWMRRINNKWMTRIMLNGAFASDLENTSSDAWQIRAGGFALFRPHERCSWAFGALATGRDDVPVIPAIGVIWEPLPELKFNLMMPNPRVAYLLADSGTRQHWGYVGGGLSGGTWAYDRSSGVGERLSYRGLVGNRRLPNRQECSGRQAPG